MPDPQPNSPDQEPLRWNSMIPFPEGPRPLTWGMKGAKWGGTVDDVLRANVVTTTPMPTKYNRISVTLTEQNVTDVIEHLDAIDVILACCVNLSDDERAHMVKLGPKTTGFDDKAFTYMQTRPEYISPLHPMVEVLKDRTSHPLMARINARMKLSARRTDDTEMLLGSERLQAGLAYMKNAGEAAARGDATAEPVYAELSEAWPGPGRAAKTEQPEK